MSLRWQLVRKEQWIDLMLHIRFSQGSGGFLEVWKDGVMLATEAGATRIGPPATRSEPARALPVVTDLDRQPPLAPTTAGEGVPRLARQLVPRVDRWSVAA